MKAKELRQKEIEELQKLLVETRRGLSNLRFRASTSEIENPSQILKARRTAARILTVLRERCPTVPPAAQRAKKAVKA